MASHQQNSTPIKKEESQVDPLVTHRDENSIKAQTELSFSIWKRINPGYVIPTEPVQSTTKDAFKPQYSDPVDKSAFRAVDKFSQWREEDLKTFGKLTSATPKAASDKKPWKF
ncbi:hypothetical protein C9374_008989 [Naegleria lovaniensis]|uniref:Uncharacterized protein n=1 Tax=Naegleria lovaniensis TaxID=51637 RepID=A0AA88GEI9_NAELO|nr:uncharacterized protein C9374_008989 [Naegleria lovaniensis]KAG2377904.1 hypothetical protein C9374_008989 [Naegleria lovaniensis]